MPKNYYIILGIPKNSSQEDIRTAYRRLAKEFHPDCYGNNQAPFQTIQEAYSVLSDPKARKSYDHSLRPKSMASASVNQTPIKRYPNEIIEPLIPESDQGFNQMNALNRSSNNQWSIFDDVFDRFLGGFVEVDDREMISSQDVSVEILLSRIQAQLGGNTHINLPIQIPCPSCHRSSRRYRYVCWRCNGTGVLMGEAPVVISYPAGITANHVSEIALEDSNGEKIVLSVVFKIRKR